MSRIISMAKKRRRWRDASVTRRDGWLWLVDHYAVKGYPGARGGLWEPAVLDVWEWSPRVGARWVCEECGWLGPCVFPSCGAELAEVWRAHGHPTHYRKPMNVGSIRVLGARREPLGAILTEPDGCALEGFPELAPAEFCRLYVGGKEPRGFPDEQICDVWRESADIYRRELRAFGRLNPVGTWLDLDREITRIEYEVLS